MPPRNARCLPTPGETDILGSVGGSPSTWVISPVTCNAPFFKYQITVNPAANRNNTSNPLRINT